VKNENERKFTVGFKRFAALLMMIVMIVGLTTESCVYAQEKKAFRVIGYYSEGLFKDSPDSVSIDGLTHLVYSFLIPKADGTLRPLLEPDAFKALVERCHQKGVKVCIAVGGWSYQSVPLDATFEQLAASEESRTRLVKELTQFVNANNLDGVEIDWEYPDPGESEANYEKIILGLSAALKPNGKAVTAALNGAWSATEGPEVSQTITASCLQAFDWINVMGYDINDKDHSPFWFSDTSIAYWTQRGVPKDKIVMGIPLYAHPSWKQYRDLVKEDPANAYRDYAPGKLDSWYNGLNTIQEKTRLALRNAGGVMLFEIHEDASGDYSAVKAIHETIQNWTAISETEAQSKIHCIIGNKEIPFSSTDDAGVPWIDSAGRTQVPVRKLVESIDGKVEYNYPDPKVTITKGNQVIELSINSDKIRINGAVKKMDTQSVIRDGRLYIPARPMLEGLGYKLEWHSSSQTLYGETP